jgi:uncharacterized protein
VKAALLSVALALLASVAPPAAAQIPLPKLETRVTDLTGTLTAAQQSALEEKLTAFEARKGAQIAVLILPSTAARRHRAVRRPAAGELEAGREAPMTARH